MDEPIYTELSEKAALDHNHDAGDIGSGKLAIARIPTGTTASTVALGNHGHTQYLTAETDPAVSAWAKAAVKPSYTAAEINAVPTSRKVNGKTLSTDIVLASTDVLGAVSLTGAALTDFNTILAPGLYIGSGTTAEAAANSPTNKGFYLRVEQLYTRTLQTVYDYTSTGRIYWRKAMDTTGTTWTAWSEMLTTADMTPPNLGTGKMTIPSGSDLNDYNTPGSYSCTSNSIATTVANRPPNTNYAFMLEVVSPLNSLSTNLVQVLTTYFGQRFWRHNAVGAWSDWARDVVAGSFDIAVTPGNWAQQTVTFSPQFRGALPVVVATISGLHLHADDAATVFSRTLSSAVIAAYNGGSTTVTLSVDWMATMV